MGQLYSSPTPTDEDVLRNCCCDIKLAVVASKHVEHKLCNAFGAQGRGLHEKVTSAVEATTEEGLVEIPHTLQRRMRRIAAIRNKILHELEESGDEVNPDQMAKLKSDFVFVMEQLRVLEKDLLAKREERDKSNETASTCVVS